MRTSKCSPEQIAQALRQAESGTPVVESCRKGPHSREALSALLWADASPRNACVWLYRRHDNPHHLPQRVNRAAAGNLQAVVPPERESDRVTTPRGGTIAGLNEMQHRGLRSVMIKGIPISTRSSAGLHASDG